jgi:hypothetical protein
MTKKAPGRCALGSLTDRSILMVPSFRQSDFLLYHGFAGTLVAKPEQSQTWYSLFLPLRAACTLLPAPCTLLAPRLL